MSSEELKAEIERKKAELTDLRTKSKALEKELQEKRGELSETKSELVSAIEARMELIEMIRYDVVRMAYEDVARASQREFQTATGTG
jgi:peptidoglycan hydrolase CwlO-like protein